MTREYKTKLSKEDFFENAKTIRVYNIGSVPVVGSINKKQGVYFNCFMPCGNNEVFQNNKLLSRKYALSVNSENNIQIIGKIGFMDILFGLVQLVFIGVICDIVYKNFADPNDIWYLLSAIDSLVLLSFIKTYFTIRCWKEINKILITQLECEVVKKSEKLKRRKV